ncbi:MAG: hflX 1 [Verrucomicrobiales bacterium]|nr:hflX 1 [Verrucomicrobiales bacterium]
MPSLFTPRHKAAPPEPGTVDTVTFSLISHTNVGKTTLARTLLRRDVGDALDQSHVTDVAEAYPMIEADGARLLLWDTPGFGDTARLLKRLRTSGQPIRWMVSQMWDRFRDRPLWCSQQAVCNVQDEADVVLYLVNASEKPDAAAYVTMEMEILEWIGKPVMVLLNQTGPPRPATDDEQEESDWRLHLQRFPVVKAVIGMDAFARCWVQEGELMDLIGPLLPEPKRRIFTTLRRVWEKQHLDVFHQSMQALGEQLAGNAADRVPVTRESVLQRLGVNRKELNDSMESAREGLSGRLSVRSVAAMDRMIVLHGLEGRSAKQIHSSGEAAFGVPVRINESLWSAVGGALTGAVGGIAAELKTGGLLMGGGALTGILLGGTGSYLLAKGFNLSRGDDHSVRWTEEHFAAQAEISLLCYLAVAHYGRGRGEWQDSVHPELWRGLVHEVVHDHRRHFNHIWKHAGVKEPDMADVTRECARALTLCSLALLRRLYPRVRLDWLS